MNLKAAMTRWAPVLTISAAMALPAGLAQAANGPTNAWWSNPTDGALAKYDPYDHNKTTVCDTAVDGYQAVLEIVTDRGASVGFLIDGGANNGCHWRQWNGLHTAAWYKLRVCLGTKDQLIFSGTCSGWHRFKTLPA